MKKKKKKRISAYMARCDAGTFFFLSPEDTHACITALVNVCGTNNCCNTDCCGEDIVYVCVRAQHFPRKKKKSSQLVQHKKNAEKYLECNPGWMIPIQEYSRQ